VENSTDRANGRRAAGEKPALGIIGKCNLLRDGQLAVATGRINRFSVRNAFQLEVLSRAAQCPLLTHHAGDAIGLLTCRPMLFTIELPVFQSSQFLLQLVPDTLVQCVTRYRSAGYAVKSAKTRHAPRPRPFRTPALRSRHSSARWHRNAPTQSRWRQARRHAEASTRTSRIASARTDW
jgi:hypothetical protein